MRYSPLWVGLLLALASRATAYPTSLNLMPVADSMDAGTLRLEIELDGGATPFANDAGLQLYTQYGVTDRLEVGVDWADVNLATECSLNAKWMVVPESEKAPAVAVGLLDMSRGGVLSEWYAVASKDVAPLRVHAGVLSDDATRGMFGAEYWPTDRAGVAADWATGAGAYHSLGVYQDLGHGVWATLYYARSNTRREPGFVGLNLLWERSP